MAAEATAAIPAVDITRVIDASPGEVYKAWASSEAAKVWFCPPTCKVLKADFEPEVGRAYSITMDTPSYGEMTAHGNFLEVVPEEKLKFSWNWVGNPDDWQTTVTVTFSESEGKTELRLFQDGFAERESRDHHEEGWQETFDILVALFE